MPDEALTVEGLQNPPVKLDVQPAETPKVEAVVEEGKAETAEAVADPEVSSEEEPSTFESTIGNLTRALADKDAMIKKLTLELSASNKTIERLVLKEGATFSSEGSSNQPPAQEVRPSQLTFEQLAAQFFNKG